jgi:cytochrome c
MKRIAGALRFGCYGLLVFAVVGCHWDMWTQPKFKPQDKSEFFRDGSASRLPVKGTVAFGAEIGDPAYTRGYVDGRLVEQMPVPLTAELLERGQERFSVFCRHCHGATGDGQGMIAQRGYNVERPVASYHTQRLREMPIGHFFDVITNGYGAMFPYSDRIPVEDRWAIAAYVRVLQRAHNATLSDVPAEFRGLMDDPASQLEPKSEAEGEAGH